MRQIVESTDPKQAQIQHQRAWVQLRTDKSTKSGVFVFTDGSSLGSYAAVVVYDGGQRSTPHTGFEAMTSTRNVGAELNGALLGLINAPEGGQVTLVFDYMGIGAWLTDNWKINDPEVEQKIATIKEVIRLRKLTVRYVHHRGHQEDGSDFTRWNNRADELATMRAETERADES